MTRAARLALPALAVVAATMAGGCAARSTPPDVPRGVGPPPVGPPAGVPAGPGGLPSWGDAPAPALAQPLLATARSLVGVPYRDGGADPSGFDCSGFVQYVFARHGWRVPRTVAAQYATGAPVASGDLRPGDLLFFATLGEGPTHVAIALDRGQFVHAPSGRGRVRVEALAGRYWPARFIGARRVVTPDRRSGS